MFTHSATRHKLLQPASAVALAILLSYSAQNSSNQIKATKLMSHFHQLFDEAHISRAPGSTLRADYSAVCDLFDSYQSSNAIQHIKQVLPLFYEPLSCSSTLYCVIPGKTWTVEENVSKVSALYENWHQLIHIVGAWAYNRCMQFSCDLSDFTALLFFFPSSYVQGWAPLHGAMTFAIAQLGADQDGSLWSFTLTKICVSRNPIPVIAVHCFHASGHGMFRVSLDSFTSTKPRPCIDPRVKSFTIQPSVLYESLRLCGNAPSKQIAAYCAGGVYDNAFAYGISSWTNPPDLSVCFSITILSQFGCFSYYFWWVQAGRYFFYREQALTMDSACTKAPVEVTRMACAAGLGRMIDTFHCGALIDANESGDAHARGPTFRRWLACMSQKFSQNIVAKAWTFEDGKVKSPSMQSVRSKILNMLSAPKERWIIGHSLRSEVAAFFEGALEALMIAKDMPAAVQPLLPTWILESE